VDQQKIPANSVVQFSDTSVTWTEKDPAGPAGATIQKTTGINSTFQTNDIIARLHDQNINPKFTATSVWVSLLFNFVPILLLMLAIYWFVFRRMAGGANAVFDSAVISPWSCATRV
jgi:ATP-dependent Zn protease